MRRTIAVQKKDASNCRLVSEPTHTASKLNYLIIRYLIAAVKANNECTAEN